MYKWILIFLLIATPCLAKDYIKQNMKVDSKFVADGDYFYMVNFMCSEINTSLPNVKKSTFEKCNILNCVLDESNVFKQTRYDPEASKPVPKEDTPEEMKERIIQLETFIEDNSLIVPIKEAIE